MLLVIPDIHGRTFWKEPCENVGNYDKIIFLGDYFDPYDFEDISVEDAIENFKEIIEFKKDNIEKVVLLIGNHDEPYISKDYYHFSTYHCRHSYIYHNKIANLFNENIVFFNIAHAERDILFTHAGVESGWLERVVECEESDISNICKAINNLQNSVDGLKKLYQISSSRGGIDKYGSCIWCDVRDILLDIDSLQSLNTLLRPIYRIKQVFGHTLQAFYNRVGNIEFGQPVEHKNIKMLDNACAYELDVENFAIKKMECRASTDEDYLMITK